MSQHPSVTAWIEDLRSDKRNVRDEAAARIWSLYAEQLLHLARKRLSPRITPREDAEDVAQCMYHSFCRRMRGGKFTGLKNRDDLLKLLIVMTKRKTLRVVTYHTRERRDVKREQTPPSRNQSTSWPTLEQEVPAEDPVPEDAERLENMLEELLRGLPEELRRIALWKVERYTNQEIAKKLGRDERTIERKMDLIRVALLEQEGCSPEEMAEKLGQSVAKIELKRKLLDQMRKRS